MRRPSEVLFRLVWGVLIAGVLYAVFTGVLGSTVYDRYIKPRLEQDQAGRGGEWKQYLDRLDDFVGDYWPWVLVAGLLPLAALAWATWYRHRARLRDEFALLKPAHRLRPEDLGFQTVRPGEPVDPNRRAYYPGCYIDRVAVPLDGGDGALDEAAVAERLRAGEGVAVHGEPTEGKTIFLWQAVRRLEGHQVVMLDPRRGRRGLAALALLRGRRVVSRAP
jgi:hypothetical protein